MLNNWASKGCTTIFDAGIGSVRGDVDGQILNKVTSVPIPVRFYGALAFQDNYKTNPPKPPVTFGKVHVPAIKYWADGSTRGFTAALKHPYLNKEDKGKLKYPTVEDLRNNMEPLYLNGWQLMVHANGDAAIEQTLDVYELLFQSHPQKNKIVHRIEHFTVTETDDLIKKAARLGIGISHTILHVFYWGHTFKEWVLGAPRALRIDPVLEEVKAGALVSFHSDSPVSEVNPLLYVRTAVTRLMFARGDQDPLGKDQCVSLLQALAGITINPARQIGMGHQIGTLERGKLADFVVLDADPRSVPGPELDQIQVVETWMGGKRVWPA
ncbi:hypothetical protein FRC17_010848 [Serendipita sp. 399]|nr:hypothetical protein FRC17_010848 [Serendipita sp. 399]